MPQVRNTSAQAPNANDHQEEESTRQWGAVMSRSKSSLAEAKREHLLDKVSATSTRTAEVTICIIPERLPDRPRHYRCTP